MGRLGQSHTGKITLKLEGYGGQAHCSGCGSCGSFISFPTCLYLCLSHLCANEKCKVLPQMAGWISNEATCPQFHYLCLLLLITFSAASCSLYLSQLLPMPESHHKTQYIAKVETAMYKTDNVSSLLCFCTFTFVMFLSMFKLEPNWPHPTGC